MNSKNLLIKIGIAALIGLFLIIAAGGIAYLIATQVVEESTEAQSDDEIVQFTGVTFSLGEFTTNLADDGARRIFQLEIILELSNSNIKSEIEERKPQIEDNIYTSIRSKTSEELNEQDGMQELRQQIQDTVNKHIREGEVVNVYFNRPLIT
ncbi:flagellar basal body-associated FliL family protein [Natranaerobius trueperi]|uniref:flagellar basal body-associated FliL family protein n=1 Tax=Natranaerobius trueperi TaxID=759412 RepID=UPI001302EB71|nr:flagellar basal body-associated FliL family protein [Natranaerobius trueperi]